MSRYVRNPCCNKRCSALCSFYSSEKPDNSNSFNLIPAYCTFAVEAPVTPELQNFIIVFKNLASPNPENEVGKTLRTHFHELPKIT